MRVPYSWLLAYCDPGMSVEQLAERLSMTGTQVERIDQAGAPSAEGFVLGRVLSAEPHPNADRLRVCEVEVAPDKRQTIVCGAPNVAAGQSVPVALPGAVLGSGQRLGRAELRGVTSEGMILSEQELEIGADSDGIVVLETELPAGTPLSELIPIAEPVLDLEITPNRPDCLSVYGVARELHAISEGELAPPPWAADAAAEGEGRVEDYASVSVEVPELCPRFTARVFTEVEIGPSPLWLKQRLSAAGQRPINNVVDITNYVMLLTGQPLHAFDLDRIRGGALVIRNAAAGERMTTLDDVERSFDEAAVLVCDQGGPSGIAGIMGGHVSEVSDATTRVLMEAACWNGPNILATSGKLGLRSEASSRFEKQLHPELTMRAQRLAATLMVAHAGARLVPGTIDVDAELYGPVSLSLRAERISGLLGMEVPEEQASSYLRRLGFEVAESATGFAVGVPADRYFDVTREVDLIEEVGRVHGFDRHLQPTLPPRPPGAGGLAPHQRVLRRAEDLLRDAGLNEVVTWAFVAPSEAARLGLPGEGGEGIAVHNPLSEELSVMRTSLLGGLIGAAGYNLARGAGEIALFESGRVYLRKAPPETGGVLAGQFAGLRPPPVREPHRIGAIIAGPLGPHSWRGEPVPADFYSGKGLIELLCASVHASVVLSAVELPFLHPGRGAEVRIGGTAAGWLGELHPRLAADHDLPPSVAFELDAAAFFEASTEGEEIYEDLTSFPAVFEDIAVVVDDAVPAAAVHAAVEAGGGELLRSARIFDLYEGEQVGAGKRSLALRLEFRAADRTLTDADVAAKREAIVAELGELGGSLRA